MCIDSERDVRRADPVAVSDRGQALNVRTEYPAQELSLGFAQLREVGGHVRHRAMVLADLYAQLARTGVLGRGCVAVSRECRSEFADAAISRRSGRSIGRA